MKEKLQAAAGKKCAKAIPLALVLLDNIPTLAMFIIGGIIIFPLSPLFSLLYLGYSTASIAWFWARICPYCAHYDTLSCPCGYGFLSAKFFQRKTGKDFKRVFKTNIMVMFPCWLAPLFIGAYILLHDYSLATLLYLILFCVTGFLLIPLISKMVGCKNCDTRDDCPWMNKC